MAKKQPEPEPLECPLRKFFDCLRGKGKRFDTFRQHVKQARIEMLLAFRSLIDRRIDDLKQPADASKGRTTKIEVKGDE